MYSETLQVRRRVEPGDTSRTLLTTPSRKERSCETRMTVPSKALMASWRTSFDLMSR